MGALSLTLLFGAPVLAQTGSDPDAIPDDLRGAPLGSSASGRLGADHGSADSGRAFTGARPDAHAPIGVMGDHVHAAGEWMLSYRYMSMDMDGNRDGTDRLSPAEVLAQGFMVTPTSMTMDMHMLGAMYAPSDDVTLMAMVPLVEMEMDHLTGMGGTFTTESGGLGDIRLGALVPVSRTDRSNSHLNLSVSLPTGGTNERDTTPAGPGQKLPYPMQIGSGTFDLLLGGTTQMQQGDFSFGAQWIETVRLGENDEDYTLGNARDITAWSAWRFADEFSSSLRLDYSSLENIDGADPELNPAVISTARTDLRAGERLDLGLGLNYERLGGEAHGLRFAIEYLFPLHQDLDGPQLEVDGTLVLGVQYAF